MPTNDIKAFAAAGGANVLTQQEYLALAALSTGFIAGKASAKEVNKAIRQATFVAAAVAQFVADQGGMDVLDDGSVTGLATKIITAINKTSQPLDATLTAIAGLASGANKLPYFTGKDTVAQTDITQVGRDIIGKGSTSDILQYLGLGEAAELGVASEDQMKEGTSETLIPSVMAVMSLFPKRTFSIPGFIRIPDVPGGLVIQWGNYVTSASSQDVNLPFTYSVAQVACVACYNGPASVYGYVTAQAKNTSQVTLHGRTSSGNPVASTFYVISIGF